MAIDTSKVDLNNVQTLSKDGKLSESKTILNHLLS